MPDNDSKPTTDERAPVPAGTSDRGVQAADAALDSERDGAAAPGEDLAKAENAGREGGTR